MKKTEQSQLIYQALYMNNKTTEFSIKNARLMDRVFKEIGF